MPPPGEPRGEVTVRRETAKEIIDTLAEIALILNTGLDRHTLSVCVSMIENGTNPEALATVVKELRKEGEEAEQIARNG